MFNKRARPNFVCCNHYLSIWYGVIKKKSEIVGYFESRLFDKKGLLQYMLNNATYAIVSWNISSFFFLPGFWERKLLLSRSIGDFFIKGQKISNNQWIAVNNYNAKPRYYAPSWLDYIALSSHIADIKIIIIITFAYLVSRGKITRSRVTVARDQLILYFLSLNT